MKQPHFNATVLQLIGFTVTTILISISDGYTICPDGCICSISGTVICDGLEMDVILPHRMDEQFADSKIQRSMLQTLQKLTDTHDDVMNMENFDNFDKSITDLSKSVHCDCQLINDMLYKPDIDELICNSPSQFNGKSVLEASRLISCPGSRKKRQGGWHPPPPPRPHPQICEPNPCMHQGRCIPNGRTYSCVCGLSYTGANCEVFIMRDDPVPDHGRCVSNPCRNQAECIVHDGNFKCLCPDGFTGLYCETQVEIHPDCDRDTCRNGGTCVVDRTGSSFCVCNSRYIGDHCETVNPCASSPCLNQGECNSDERGNYHCSCLREYSGRNCEFLMVDPCASSPCLNRGICTVDVRNGGGYKCDCAEEYGYQGERCEMQLKVKITHATNASISTMWDFIDPNRYPVFSIEISWIAQDRKKSEPFMFQSETVAPFETKYKIERLLPSTGYEICVRVVFSNNVGPVKTCVQSGTYPTDYNPGPTSPSRIEHHGDHDGIEFHTFGLIVFGIGIAICAIAIIVVAVLYHKRVQSSRNTHLSPVSSTTTLPSQHRHTRSNANINDIQVRIAVPDTIPIINVTEHDEIGTEIDSEIGTDIGNELSADQPFHKSSLQTIHEENEVTQSNNNSSPQAMVNGTKHHPTDSNMNSPIIGVESDV